MRKLILLKEMDENALRAALSIEDAAVVLMQDAVHLARESPLLAEAFNKRTIYVLGVDAGRRGLDAESMKGLRSLSYGELVDLMFSGVEVINL